MFDKNKYREFNKQREKDFKDNLYYALRNRIPNIGVLDLDFLVLKINLMRLQSENEMLKELNRMKEETNV